LENTKIYDTVIEEIYNSERKDCCVLPFLSATIRGIARLIFTKNGFALKFQTQDIQLITYIQSMLKKVQNVIYDIEKSFIDKGYVKGEYYTLYVPVDDANVILEKTYIIKNKCEIIDNIPNELFEKKCCKGAYIAGLFASCGTLTTPDAVDLDDRGKTKGGYHLEFNINSDLVKDEIKKIIKSIAEIDSDTIHFRANSNGIYIKNADSIGYIIAAMGCQKSFFIIQDIITSREFKNRLNRVNNSTLANIDKVVDAGEKQVLAIKLIDEKLGINVLSPQLIEFCNLRLNNYSASLSELAQLCVPPSTKSGMNHRMRKVLELAEDIRTKEEEKN